MGDLCADATAAAKVERASDPVTLKERLKAGVVAIGMILTGIGMWVWHNFYVSDLIHRLTGGEAVHQFRVKIDLIWCRPTGAILILLGGVVLLGVLTKKSTSGSRQTAGKPA